MGGSGSGRTSYRSLVEYAVSLDLRLLMRRGWVRDGLAGAVKLRVATGDGQHMPIRLSSDLTYPYEGSLALRYTRALPSGRGVEVKQRIQLKVTEPHFGGRRWWMICPHSGRKVAKLYLPPGGDTFADREAWRLAYRSQRADAHAKAFQRLNRLQRQLGCEEVWGAEPTRPKGMWHKTFATKIAKYHELDDHCAAMAEVMLDDARKLVRA